jgi:hypothetical protein
MSDKSVQAMIDELDALARQQLHDLAKAEGISEVELVRKALHQYHAVVSAVPSQQAKKDAREDLAKADAELTAARASGRALGEEILGSGEATFLEEEATLRSAGGSPLYRSVGGSPLHQLPQPDDVVEMVWDPKVETWSEFDARVKDTVPEGSWFRVSTSSGVKLKGIHRSPLGF